MSRDPDYVLGTDAAEIARLGLQHCVWRPRASDAWRRAGFTLGQTVLDVGCGPGYATLDLAEIVGPTGRVFAVDKSRRFLDALETERRRRELDNVTALELDLDEEGLPSLGADAAWCRWIFAFVKRPQDVLARIRFALGSGGILVLHEYFDYSTWRVVPRSPEIEEFVRVVMESWRAHGGEPDVGRYLPQWLAELGFDAIRLNPIVDVVSPSHFVWQWPKAFLESGLRRLVALGNLTEARAESIARALAATEAAPHALMITPAVLEVIAIRR